MALITVVLPRQRPRAMRRTGLDGPRGLPRRRSPHQPLSGCRGELPPVTRQHAPTPAAAAPAVRPAARRPLSSAAAANPLRVPRRVPPSLSCTHRHQAAAVPAVRPAARRPLSSAGAATPLRVPRRVPAPLVCQHATTHAAAAPAVRPAARRPPSSAAAATPLRVPRRVLPPLIRQHAPTHASSSRAGCQGQQRAARPHRPPQQPLPGCRGEYRPQWAQRRLDRSRSAV